MNELAATIGPTPLSGVAQDVPTGDDIHRFGALSQRVYAAHAGHVIAAGRIIIAFVLLLFLLPNAGGTWLRSDFDALFVYAFAAFAFAALIISCRSWYLDFSLSEAFIVADILAFVILTASRTTLDANSVAAALCLVAYILFVSVLRWRSGLVFGIAVFVNTFWIANIVLFELPRRAVDQGGAWRWGLFIILESAIVIWASIHKLKVTLPRFAGAPPDPILPSTASTMGYASAMAGADDAVLCWIDPGNRGCYMLGSTALDEDLPPVRLSFGAAEGFRNLAPMIFDMRRGRGIVLADGKLAARDASTMPGRALLAEIGVKEGICIPVDGEEGQAWLVLTGVWMLGWGHLHLANAIRSEIAQGMAWQTTSTNALNAALFKLRRTVACDLHDSVAHSLAGARFLLVALRAKVDPASDIAAEIDTIRDAIDEEHLHVRRLIEQLRETNADSRLRNLIEDLEAVGQALASRWQVAVELHDSDFRIQVPVWVSMEVQQIVREAISNGVRHGKASRVRVKCVRRLGSIEIEVHDNGSGFPDPKAPSLPRSISERLGELGGSLEIASNSSGTTLCMRVPAATNM